MKTGWVSIELQGYREHPESATYSLFSYQELPPIPTNLGNEFEWLKSELDAISSIGDAGPGDCKLNPGKLAEIEVQISILLPESFKYFINNPDLQYRVPSCTDCYLDLADRAVKVKGTDGFLIHFLSDSQWCCHWYLYVDKSQEHFVVASDNAYGFNIPGDDNDPYYESCYKNEIDLDNEEIWYCAPSFTEFIYRYWMENEIAMSLLNDEDQASLTPAQQAYLDHYLKLKK